MAALAERQAGSVVAGRYRLLRVLGRGGMGVVFEAEHAMTRRRVAVKILHPQQRESTEAARRFINEAQSAGKLSHPNVVEVLDAGEDNDGSLFLVLELLAGQDLATRILKKRRLDVAEVVTVIAQVAQALSTAHAHGIIHRDIKPENIYLTRSVTGEVLVKILDFGISKAMHPDPSNANLSVTQTNTTVGTPHYMSPEQARGERTIDPRADLWAVGVVMYECLAGRVPFDGDTYNDQIVKVITEPHVSLAQYDVPSDLSRVVDRLLEKDRTRRYPNAAELLKDLRAFVNRHPEYPVSPHILRDPVLPGPATASSRPDSPTLETSLDPAQNTRNTFSVPAVVSSLTPAPGVRNTTGPDTIPNMPHLTGGSLYDTGNNDNSPTKVLDTERGDAMPGWKKLAIGAVVVLVAIVAGVVIALALQRKPLPPPAAMVTLKLTGLPPGAKLNVNGVPIYNSDTAVVPRSAGAVPVDVIANGFAPLHTTVVADRDQTVALALVAVPVAIADAGTMNTPAVTALPDVLAVPVATEDASAVIASPDAGAPEAMIAPTRDASTANTDEPNSANTNTNTVAPTNNIAASANTAGTAPRPATTTTATPTTTTTPAVQPRVPSAPVPTGPGSITVHANPSCTVVIDGSLRGTSPVIRSPAPSGRHQVFCRLDTGALRSRIVMVQPGREALVEFLP